MIKIKTTRIISLILIFLLSVGSFVYADNNDALTVQDALKIAMSNSVEVKKYTSAVKRNERDVNETIISTRHLDDILKIDNHYRKLAMKPNRTQAEEMEYQMLKDNLGGYMSFSQRLEMDKQFQLGASNMEYVLGINRSLLKAAKDNVYISVYGSFNNLSKIEDSMKVKNSLISNLEASYKVANAKYAQGMLSSSSLKLMKLELDKARIEYNTLGIERQKCLMEINKVLGVAVRTEFNKYINDSVPKDITIKELNEYMDIAFEKREDIKSAEQYFELKQKEYDITKEYYYYDTTVTNKNAQIELNSAKNKFESTKIDTQLQVMNAYNSFSSQLTNLEKVKTTKDINEQALQAAKSRYQLGLNTELELSKANASYVQSQLAYINASRDTWLAKLKLDMACGLIVNNN